LVNADFIRKLALIHEAREQRNDPTIKSIRDEKPFDRFELNPFGSITHLRQHQTWKDWREVGILRPDYPIEIKNGDDWHRGKSFRPSYTNEYRFWKDTLYPLPVQPLSNKPTTSRTV
jgi:hypothetical protein